MKNCLATCYTISVPHLIYKIKKIEIEQLMKLADSMSRHTNSHINKGVQDLILEKESIVSSHCVNKYHNRYYNSFVGEVGVLYTFADTVGKKFISICIL